MPRSLLVLVIAVLAVGLTVATGEAAGHRGRHHHARHHKHHKHHKPAKAKAKPVPATPLATASGDLVAGGVFHLVFDARREPNAPTNAATGSFTGTLELAGSGVGDFAGPVTCLDVDGNDIGLFYPIDESSPPGLQLTASGIFITVRTDGAGHAVASGFVPSPMRSTETCAPGAAPLQATGRATATER